MTEKIRVKLEDVARKAGVGNATASRALSGVGKVSEESRRRILNAAEVLQYRPNRSAQELKGGRSGMIGMVVPHLSDLFFASCVDAVGTVAMNHASLLVVSATRDRSDLTTDALNQLLHHNVDGLVLATSEYLSAAMARSLRAMPIPIVGIDAPLTKAGLPSVLLDNRSGARVATEHLIGHGLQRIVSVQANPGLFTMRERRAGYEDAMLQAGLHAEQHTVDDRAIAENLLRAYKDTPGRYAFLAGNETAAKYMLAAAKHLSLHMPRDFAMISFDDFDLADSMEPPLTVLRQPVGRIGEAAATLLFRNMKEGAPPAGDLETMLSAELVVRQSCGCRA